LAGLAFAGERLLQSSTVRPLRHGLVLGIAFGVAANLGALRFVPGVVTRFTTLGWAAGDVGLALLALLQSLRWGAASFVHVGLRRLGVPGPWAFAIGVLAGTFVPAVFPWNPAGGVTPVPELIQLASWIGERGLTWLMALSAGFLGSAFTTREPGERREGKREGRPSLLPLAVAVALPALTYVQGHLAMAAVEATRATAPTARVALIQPSIAPTERWNPGRSPGVLAALTNATREAEQLGSELTIWPEAAYPYVVGHATRRCPIGPLAMLPFGVRGPVLTGLVTTNGEGNVSNSAVVCQRNGTLSPPQDKIHLLMFGETIPWLDQIEWVRSKFTRGIGLVAGHEVVLQNVGPLRAAVLNCFEDTLPGAGRESMAARPNLLVNVTNDGWFAGSVESELHLRLAVLRAVESRRDLVRAVNLGMTSWVDAAGLVRERRDGSAPAVLMAEPALLETPPTPFDRFGDAPLLIFLALTAITLASRASRASRRVTPEPTAADP
jgi:apolipoprotein N-acyltransferase